MLFNEDTTAQYTINDDATLTFGLGKTTPIGFIQMQRQKEVPQSLNTTKQKPMQILLQDTLKKKPNRVLSAERKNKNKKLKGRVIKEKLVFCADTEEEARKWVYLIRWLLKH